MQPNILQVLLVALHPAVHKHLEILHALFCLPYSLFLLTAIPKKTTDNFLSLYLPTHTEVFSLPITQTT